METLIEMTRLLMRWPPAGVGASASADSSESKARLLSDIADIDATHTRMLNACAAASAAHARATQQAATGQEGDDDAAGR